MAIYTFKGTDGDNTAALNKAIDALRMGDELVISKGTWKVGPVDVAKSDVTITFEEGAELLFIYDDMAYPPVFTRWEGQRCYAMHPCFFIHDSKKVTVRGKGILNGNGAPWWEQTMRKKHIQIGPYSMAEHRLAALNPNYENQPGGGGGRPCQFLRPPLLQIYQCKDVEVDGLMLKDSPFWTLHPVFSVGLKLRNITIDNPADAPNTDGIDIDSCRDVEIDHCKVHVGDDGIAIKSGVGEDALEAAFPSSNIYVHDCIVEAAHGGAVIGSETGCGVHDVKVENCVYTGTDRGVRIKTRRGRAGDIHGLSFKHLKMENVLCPITVNMYYACGSDDENLYKLDKQPVTDTTPHIYDVEIEDIQVSGVRAACGFIVGLPEAPITGLSIKDCHFSLAAEKDLVDPELASMSKGLPPAKSRGIRLRNVDVKFEGITGAQVDQE